MIASKTTLPTRSRPAVICVTARLSKWWCGKSPERIQELIDWGTQFDERAGELLLGARADTATIESFTRWETQPGRRSCGAVVHWTQRFPNVQLWKQAFTIDLVVYDGQCRGAIIWNPHHGKMIVWAKQTILCTGGSGQIYRESTNPSVATGDGLAMAYRAGAEVRDMEFIQFHPTVLYIAGSSRSLITEAMRGEGAHLVDATGHRFMTEYDDRAELALRDIVAQAIISQMTKTHHPCVYLTVSHLPAEQVRSRFPGIAHTCAKFGIDITTDQIPVRPGAHYMIGGVSIDSDGRTKVPGLWAAGEATSSGLHGANRLASNSLLEGLVYGAHAGRGAADAARQIPDDFRAPPVLNDPAFPTVVPLDLADIRNSLKSLMGRAAGVRRDGAELSAAANTIDNWCKYVLPQSFGEPGGWELQNMLLVAQLIIRAALVREESRGVHLRVDFPSVDDEHWHRHLAWCRETDTPQIA